MRHFLSHSDARCCIPTLAAVAAAELSRACGAHGAGVAAHRRGAIKAPGRSADRIRQWYEKRWGIEEFFRLLKSGARIEARHFDDAADLVKCLAFDAAAAWRVLDLHRVARREPDRLASGLFDDERAIVQMMAHRISRKRPIRPPPGQTAAEFMVDLGRIGGFRPTKKQPLPGTGILWKAMKRLMIAAQAISSHKDHRDAETSSYKTSVSSV